MPHTAGHQPGTEHESLQTKGPRAPLLEGEVKLVGHGLSSGIGLAEARLVSLDFELEKRMVPAERVEGEIRRLNAAIAQVTQDIDAEESALTKLNERSRGMWLPLRAMLCDPMLLESTEQLIRNKHLTAECAYSQAMEGFISIFAKLEGLNSCRVVDCREVRQRVISTLIDRPRPALELTEIRTPVVLVGEDITAEMVLRVPAGLLKGMATGKVGKDAHAVIVAPGLTPVVGSLHLQGTAPGGELPLRSVIRNGDRVLVDGDEGVVIVRPTEATLQANKRYAQSARGIEVDVSRSTDEALTKDGVPLILKGNVNTLADLPTLKKARAMGVGLFRTETLFLAKGTLLDEEEQYRAFCLLAESMKDRGAVTIRTLDFSEDKTNERLMRLIGGGRTLSENASLADILAPHMRAILRASAHGNVQIMFPMINDADEFKLHVELLNEQKRALDAAGEEYNRDIRIGAMLETPAAAELAVTILEHADFGGIGTNDMVSSTLQTDRLTHSPTVYHPAVLRNFKKIVVAAKLLDKPLHVCGRMASTPEHLPILLGLGVRNLSVEPACIAAVARAAALLDTRECEGLCLKMQSVSPHDAGVLLGEFNSARSIA